MGPIETQLHEKLLAGLAPERMQLVNDSAKHHNKGAESHWNLIIVAAAFEGKALVMRHRAVFDALGKPLMDVVHSLTMKTLTPAEWDAAGGEVTNPVPPCSSHKHKH
jgi:BolA protein